MEDMRKAAPMEAVGRMIGSGLEAKTEILGRYMRRLIALLPAGLTLACFCFAAIPLHAQKGDRGWVDSAWNYRVEVFGTVAHGSFYNGSRKWGSGLDLGGGIGVRPFSGRLRGLGFDLRFARIGEDNGNPATGASSLDAKMIAADALYHFRGRTPFQPYVFAGVGVAMTHYVRDCNTCVYTAPPSQGGVAIPTHSEVKTNKAGINLGAGLKFGANRWLSVSPEISLLNTTPGSGWNFGWVRVQMHLGIHF